MVNFDEFVLFHFQEFPQDISLTIGWCWNNLEYGTFHIMEHFTVSQPQCQREKRKVKFGQKIIKYSNFLLFILLMFIPLNFIKSFILLETIKKKFSTANIINCWPRNCFYFSIERIFEWTFLWLSCAEKRWEEISWRLLKIESIIQDTISSWIS